MKRLDWFPDWSDRPVVIVASGPSAAGVDLEPARGKARIIALNSSVRLCPWADMVYGCDASWWLHENGLSDFKGLKIAGEARATQSYQDIRTVKVIAHIDTLVWDQPGCIGSGGNSGFQSINLAVLFGARKLILVGYDMQIDGGLHWHGKHPAGLNNPTAKNVPRWRRAIDGVQPELERLGVTVWNCSPVSALQAFPKTGFAEAIHKCCRSSEPAV